jgi:hypothetical protein
MELYQRGIIDRTLTGMPLEWGNGEALVELIRQIAHREGFGNILAEGSFARERLGEGSGEYLLEIKNLPIEMTDERLPKSFALGLATSSRGACHMRSRPSIDVLGLPEKVLAKVYGGPVSNHLLLFRKRQDGVVARTDQCRCGRPWRLSFSDRLFEPSRASLLPLLQVDRPCHRPNPYAKGDKDRLENGSIPWRDGCLSGTESPAGTTPCPKDTLRNRCRRGLQRGK